MDIGHAATTPEFAGLAASKGSDGNLREVDPDETPITQNIRLRSRMEALTKTVEMGRRYFPNCSEVLDKFMEDDLPDLFYHEKGTPDEQRIKKTRFMELKEDQGARTFCSSTMNILTRGEHSVSSHSYRTGRPCIYATISSAERQVDG
ncbi:hypothetical protein NC652_035377 [Populus alba x Populus x berolinensis]|nr:hypothetical protein NC652_035377 [Populus alba x Populus x berolinensis]